MIKHYYTFYHIAREMNKFIGCNLTECFTQERSSLMLKLSDDNIEQYVQFIGDGKKDTIFLRDTFSRAKKNTKDIFPDVINDTFQGAIAIDKNRIVKWEFINSNIYFQIFGGKNSIAFLTDKEDKIIDVFNGDNKQVGQQYIIPENRISLFSEFSPDDNLLDAVARSEYMLGNIYAEEAIARSGMTAWLKIREVKKEKLPNILLNLKKVADDLLKSKEYYLIKGDDGKQFISLIELIKYPDIIKKSEDLSELIRSVVIQSHKTESTKDIKGYLKNILNREEKKLAKNIKINEDTDTLQKNADKYREFGEVLMSQPEPKKKYGNNIEVIDFSGKKINIKLNKDKNLIENAKYFFSKSKKSEQEIQVRLKRLPEQKEKHRKYLQLLEDFNKAQTLSDYNEIKDKLKKEIGLKMQKDKPQQEEKFRKFDLGDNYELFVGKNAANNDELTMKFAKPNDLWLHARGSSGSHAVLKIPGKQKPPKKIIEKAAAVAAYYSGAKNSKYAPVAYTYKKYVRKPKGANKGAVVIAREDVIMVEPGLPD